MQALIVSLMAVGLIFVVLVIIAVYAVTRSRAQKPIRFKGPSGPQPYVGSFANGSERRVHNTLSSLYPESESCHLMSGIVLQDNRGNLHQIDHVLIKENGLFVIETKNWCGAIRGQERSDEWTLFHANGDTKSLQNPLRQNYVHAWAVEDWVSSIIKPIAVVIMVKNNKPFDAYDLDLEDKRMNYLINFEEIPEFFSADFGVHLSPDQVKACQQKLMKRISKSEEPFIPYEKT